MNAQHTDDTALTHHDEIEALVMKLVHEPIGAWIGVLGNCIDEGTIVEAVNLLEFLASFRALKDVGTDTQHPGHLQRCSAWEPADLSGGVSPLSRPPGGTVAARSLRRRNY